MTELVASVDDFVVRPATADDLGYVRKTWLRDFACESDWIDIVGGGLVYFTEHGRARDAAIERGATLIACRRNVPTGICGFAVTETDAGVPLVHYVHVKPRWRRFGVAKLLLRPLLGETVIYTHRTRIVGALPVPEAWKYNPYPFLRST